MFEDEVVVQDGTTVEYYEDNVTKKKEVYRENGKILLVKLYNKEGKKYCERIYRSNGTKPNKADKELDVNGADKLYKLFYPNGVEADKMFLNGDQMVGTHEARHENGKFKLQEKYDKNSKLIGKPKRFDIKGKEITEKEKINAAKIGKNISDKVKKVYGRETIEK